MARCTCGVENVDSAKFCKACGQPIMAAGVAAPGGGFPGRGGPGQPFQQGWAPIDAPSPRAGQFGQVPPTRMEGHAAQGQRPTALEDGALPRDKGTVFDVGGNVHRAGNHTVVVGDETRHVVGFLVAVRGKGAPPYTDFPIFDGKNPIGSGPGNQIVLRDERVSSQHATIVAQGGVCTLMDLGSSNGTVVNGKKILHEPLAHETQIRLGGTSLVFIPVPNDQERK